MQQRQALCGVFWHGCRSAYLPLASCLQLRQDNWQCQSTRVLLQEFYKLIIFLQSHTGSIHQLRVETI